MVIPARVPYTAPQVPPEYKPDFFRTQLTSIARSIAPVVTRRVLASTTVAATDDVLLCNSASPLSVTLLPASQVQFLPLAIKNIGAGVVTVVGTVDATVNLTLAQWAGVWIVSDGNGWYLLGSV